MYNSKTYLVSYIWIITEDVISDQDLQKITLGEEMSQLVQIAIILMEMEI